MPEAPAAASRLRWLPPIVPLVGSLSWAGYQLAPPALAELVIAPYAVCLLLGAALVYPAARAHGAGPRAGIAWGLVLPLLWLAKEFYRVTAVFSPGETLYYALNPISLGVFAAAATEMALAELIITRRRTGDWRLAGGAGLTLMGIALLALAVAVVGRESGGREIFYAYIALYRALFPGG